MAPQWESVNGLVNSPGPDISSRARGGCGEGGVQPAALMSQRQPTLTAKTYADSQLPYQIQPLTHTGNTTP